MYAGVPQGLVQLQQGFPRVAHMKCLLSRAPVLIVPEIKDVGGTLVQPSGLERPHRPFDTALDPHDPVADVRLQFLGMRDEAILESGQARLDPVGTLQIGPEHFTWKDGQGAGFTA